MDQGQARSQHVRSKEIARGLNGYEKGGRTYRKLACPMKRTALWLRITRPFSARIKKSRRGDPRRLKFSALSPRSAFDGVAALAVFSFRRFQLEAHLLAHRAGKKTTY